MNPQPAGTLNKYQPSDARDFVDFSKYNKLTLQNVKEACEQFYNRPHGAFVCLQFILSRKKKRYIHNKDDIYIHDNSFLK